MAVERVPGDTLSSFCRFYAPHAEEDYVDADGPWQAAVHRIRADGGDLGRVRRELAAVLAEGLTDAQLHLRTVSLVALPAGRDVRAFLEYVLRRIDEALADPTSSSGAVGPANEGQVCGEGVVHRSRFTDKAAADLAVRDVLRAHEGHFRSWASQSDGTPRLHLVADLGRVIGSWRGADADGRLTGEATPSSVCAVLLRQDDETGRPVVVTSYPEPTLTPSTTTTRARYPDLVGLFGGFFGQDLRVVDHDFWSAERHFHRDTDPVVIARVVEQVGLLLSEQPTEEELRVAVHDLGSCLDPPDLRRWVRGLLRRSTDLEWPWTSP